MITPTAREGGYLPISAYGLIGDGRSAALVSSDGSVDWLCLPRFDGESLFGRLLDARGGGHWQLAPRGPYRVLQRYGDRSNVLQTVFETRTGRVVLSDLMPMTADPSAPRLVRILECLGGEVTLRHECVPAPGFATGGRAVAAFDGGVLGVDGDGGRVLITGTEPLTRTREELLLLAGESVAFGLHLLPPLPPAPGAGAPGWSTERALRLRDETQEHWWRWAAGCGYSGPHPEAIFRSALALRLLIDAPTGAMVAAPTGRDLRLISLHQASAVPSVFLRLGLVEEAEAASGWLERHGAGGSTGATTEDGEPPLAAEFHRAGAMARRGEVERAERLFELLLTQRSSLGLLSGEADPRTGELLGSYPRAATHLALVAAALDIERGRAGPVARMTAR